MEDDEFCPSSWAQLYFSSPEPSLQSHKTTYGCPRASCYWLDFGKKMRVVKTWISFVIENRWKIENQRVFLHVGDLRRLGRVGYHTARNAVACVTTVEKFHGLRAEGRVLFVFSTFAVLFRGETEVMVGYGGGTEGWKCKGSDKCPHLSELNSEPLWLQESSFLENRFMG